VSGGGRYNSIEMDEGERELTKRWIETWREAGPLLEEIRQKELAAMTEDEARRASEALLSLADAEMYVPPDRRRSSGLVEQQRLFGRLRRR
jgi:hypothetical protein